MPTRRVGRQVGVVVAARALEHGIGHTDGRDRLTRIDEEADLSPIPHERIVDPVSQGDRYFIGVDPIAQVDPGRYETILNLDLHLIALEDDRIGVCRS